MNTNLTISADRQVIERARTAAESMGISLNQALRDYLLKLAGDETLEHDLQFIRKYSGAGNSGDWKWNREEIYDRH